MTSASGDFSISKQEWPEVHCESSDSPHSPRSLNVNRAETGLAQYSRSKRRAVSVSLPPCPHSQPPAHLPISQMPEEEAFCVFVRLMQEYRLRELFKPSMAELGLCIYQFEYMLQVSGTRVAHHHPLLCSPQSSQWVYLTENSRAEKSYPEVPAQKGTLVPRKPCGTASKHTSRDRAGPTIYSGGS